MFPRRQTFDDGSETRLSRRKLLKTVTGFAVDYSVYNPVQALGGTHLASLLTDPNTVTTINSIIAVSYPTAVVMMPVTTSRDGGSDGGGIGSSSNNTNSPTYSPTPQVVVSTSNTTSKNYDNYVFIGASVLGGLMLLGMGGGGLYYLKKKKEHMKLMQNRQNGLVLVVKPPVLLFSESNSSAFSIRRNTVVPVNNNDDEDKGDNAATSRIDEDEGAKVDEYNLWGDLDIESSISSSLSAAFTPSYSGVVTPSSLNTIKVGPNPQDLQSAISKLCGKVSD